MGNYNNNREYSNSRYNNNGSNRGNFQSKPQKKHSGARELVFDKKVIIYAWNVSKERGMINLVAREYKDVKKKEGGAAETRVIFICNVTFKRTGQVVTMNGIYHTQGDKRGRLYLPALGMVANPQAPNKGYFGRASVPKNK